MSKKEAQTVRREAMKDGSVRPSKLFSAIHCAFSERTADQIIGSMLNGATLSDALYRLGL